MCGIFGAVDVPLSSYYTYQGLAYMQLRGEESCGIISVKNSLFYIKKSMGSVKDAFKHTDFESELPGNVAIGQNRYATSGSTEEAKNNMQPFLAISQKWGPIAIAHNGTLNNFKRYKKELTDNGVEFETTTDTELFFHILNQSNASILQEAIIETLQKIQAAYSLLILTADHCFAIRDKFGIKPLSYAIHKKGFFISSENYFFPLIKDTTFIRDISPGEMIIFNNKTKFFESNQYAEKKYHFCEMEGAYFSNPRDTVCGCVHEDFRQACGQQIFDENPHLDADAIIPTLESGQQGAIGFSKISGVPYKEYVMRVFCQPTIDVNRSFTCPTQTEREFVVQRKFLPRTDKIKGKSIIVVDDSLVRGTTIKAFVKMLRLAGAAYITVAIATPPIISICPSGQDYQTLNQLSAYKALKNVIAQETSDNSCEEIHKQAKEIIRNKKFYKENYFKKTEEEIRRQIGADGLHFLSLSGLEKVAKKTYRCGLCTGCFGGNYPILPEEIEE